MTITVEDGLGLAAADSYATVAETEAYGAANGETAFAALSVEAKESILVDTTTVLDGMVSWPGGLLVQTQALSWPRNNATDREGRVLTGVPLQIKRAQMELAVQYARIGRTAMSQPDPTVSRTVEKVGPVESETEYSGGFKANQFPMVWRLLSRIVRANPNTKRIVRS